MAAGAESGFAHEGVWEIEANVINAKSSWLWSIVTAE